MRLSAAKFETIALAAILLFAAALRLSRLDLIQFDFDDGITCIYGAQMLEGKFHLAGLRTSLLFYNPPLFLYLTALPMVVSRNPMFIAGCVALLNTGAILFVWRAGRKCWGVPAGLAAALLMAACPAAVLASRRVYAQDFVAPFSCALFFFAARLLIEKRKRDAFWVVFLPLCLAQIHYSGVFLIAALLAAWAWVRPEISRRAAFAGAAAACVPLLPFFAHLIITRLEDVSAVLAALKTGGNKIPTPWWTPWRHAFDLAWDTDMPLTLWDIFDKARAVTPGGGAMALAWKIVSASAFLIFAARAFRGNAPDRPLARLLLCWGLLPPALYTLSRLQIIPSYLFILYPLPFLMGGWAAGELWRRGAGAGAASVRSAAVAFVLIPVIFQTALLVNAARGLDAAGDGAPYTLFRDLSRAFQHIASEIDKSPPRSIRLAQNYQTDTAGIGYNYLYALHLARGFRDKSDPLAPSAQAATTILRIVDSNARVRYPEGARWMEDALARAPVQSFGTLRVYTARNK